MTNQAVTDTLNTILDRIERSKIKDFHAASVLMLISEDCKKALDAINPKSLPEHKHYSPPPDARL